MIVIGVIRDRIRAVIYLCILAMILVGMGCLSVFSVGLVKSDSLRGEEEAGSMANIETQGSIVKRSSSALAISADGRWLLAVNPDSDSVSIIDLNANMAVHEIAVGEDPRTVAINDDGKLAYSANRAGNSISVIDITKMQAIFEIEVGARPYGVVISPDGERLYIAVQGADQLVVMETDTLQINARFPTADRPSGLALSDNGRTLLISHLLRGEITMLNLPLERLFLPAVLGSGPKGLVGQVLPQVRPPTDDSPSSILHLWPNSNLVQSIVIAPGEARVYIPHTLSNSGNAALTLDTTMAPVVSVVDLPTRQHVTGEQFNLEILDPPAVGLPFDAAFTPDGSEMWVLNAASNDITVINLETEALIAHIETGDNPRGIVISPDGQNTFVNNTLAGTISVIDTAAYTVTATIPITTIPLESELLAGKRLFNSSDDPRMGVDQWMSCNSCHFDGENDGRTWLLGFAGPRNTTSLQDLSETLPLRWSGEWDEAADSEFAIRMDSFGTGLIEGELQCSLDPPDCANQPPHAGLSADLDALAAYISSLATPLSPGHVKGQPLTAAEERGQGHFNDPAIGCAGCHPAPTFTDNLLHDVGTVTEDERIGPRFNTPSLRGLYDSPPYFHDGSAETLLDAVTYPSSGAEHDVSGRLSPGEIADLIAFLLALPYEE
jgi:YVTN family beta-propeller protein